MFTFNKSTLAFESIYNLVITPTLINRRCYISWFWVLNKIINLNLNPVNRQIRKGLKLTKEIT